MNRRNVLRGAVWGWWMVFSLFTTVPQLAAWEWPFIGPDVTIGADENDSRLRNGATGSFRFVNRSGGDVPVLAPISGELLFLDEMNDSENRGGDVVVIRDTNELWVILRLYGMKWSDQSFPVAEQVGTGDVLGRAEVVELQVYDRLAQRYVNPRALFPYTDRLPLDGLPPLTVLQSGVANEPDQLMPGIVQIVISREDMEFSRFPRSVYVLRNGLLQAQYSFVFEDDVSSLTTPEGDLLLFKTNVVTGLNEIELEAQRFDGTVERRTVRLFVPDVPEKVETTPLDTP